MKPLLTLWRRLFQKPVELVPVRFVQPGVSTEEHEAYWRSGYSVGFAQGELQGRQALADEIGQEFRLPITAADAARIKVRQVH